MVDDLCQEIERGSATLLILLDVSMGFDTIDHGTLLDCVSGLSLEGTILLCF